MKTNLKLIFPHYVEANYGRHYCKVGRILSAIRFNVGDGPGDMAAKIGISSSLLSSICAGRRHVYPRFVQKVNQVYSLNDIQYKALENSAIETLVHTQVDMSYEPWCKKILFWELLKHWDAIDENVSLDILTILRGIDHEHTWKVREEDCDEASEGSCGGELDDDC